MNQLSICAVCQLRGSFTAMIAVFAVLGGGAYSA